MKPITAVLSAADLRVYRDSFPRYLNHPLIHEVLAVSPSVSDVDSDVPAGIRIVEGKSISSGATLNRILETSQTSYLLVLLPGGPVEWTAGGIEKLLQIAEDSTAGIVYSDYRDENADGTMVDHPVIDYHIGSIRDSFDFGAAILISRQKAIDALAQSGPIAGSLEFGALYDLRLKLSEVSEVRRLPEYLYFRKPLDQRDSGERIFDYVNPAQRAFQIEMEKVATEHLRRIGALLTPGETVIPQPSDTYPVEASVVIPVRNRVRTIEDAVRSALSQQAPFDYNVIVVDNHSSDGTTAKLAELGREDGRVKVIEPERNDLEIGGCWNAAIFSEQCGRFAVQLDSDDLYASDATLRTMVSALRSGPYAMVIGSYTIVDFDLNVLPPGVIDHREWTDENGLNNALRINGLGAPRAFDVSILRQIGFPNVSYGEDYAVALRMSREYRVGRVYESVYLARRWGGNSDSGLSLKVMNIYDGFKDSIRRHEILARIEKNRGAES